MSTDLEARIAEVLATAEYRFEREDGSHRVDDYPKDEQDAYRENGGFSEGAAAIQVVRRSKLAAMLAPLVREAQADALVQVARTLTPKECSDAARRSRNSPLYKGSIEEPFAILLERRAAKIRSSDE